MGLEALSASASLPGRFTVAAMLAPRVIGPRSSMRDLFGGCRTNTNRGIDLQVKTPLAMLRNGKGFVFRCIDGKSF
jgi:hypothetical protein